MVSSVNVSRMMSAGLLLSLPCARPGFADEKPTHDQVAATAVERMKLATEFMRTHVAVRGGYVYDVTLDLKRRRGEGVATATEIWVQPPGTPTVGNAFIRAWEATGDPLFLDAAVECADALLHGQLESGQAVAPKLKSVKSLRKDAEEILFHQDAEGRWVTDKDGRAVKIVSEHDPGTLFLESNVFAENMTDLAEFVKAVKLSSSAK